MMIEIVFPNSAIVESFVEKFRPKRNRTAKCVHDFEDLGNLGQFEIAETNL